MNIEIISVGKLKEKYLTVGINEYLKRLKGYCSCQIIEVKDEATKENMSPVEVDRVLAKEAEQIRDKIKSDRQVIVLAIEGQAIRSEDLAQKIKDYATYGSPNLCFIIGGSLGLHPRIKQKADWVISLGRITLPHQLTRLVLVEQIYRAFRINQGHAYHK